MAKRSSSKSWPKELPPCEGPKLHLFEHRHEKIQWHERLDVDEDRSVPAQGCVFRARIKGRDYAIKIFKFYDPRRVKRLWAPLIGNDTSLDTIAYYADPFFNECRAYGRIHEAIRQKKIQPDIVIPCHGFMFLADKDRQILEGRGMDLQLNHVPREYQQAAIGGFSAKAIVKDLAPGSPGVNEKSIRQVLRHILTLNHLGIYNMDVRLDNFKKARLVDFGSSRTDPHIFLQHSTDENADADRVADRTMFSEMLEEQGIVIPGRTGIVHHMVLRRRRK